MREVLPLNHCLHPFTCMSNCFERIKNMNLLAIVLCLGVCIASAETLIAVPLEEPTISPMATCDHVYRIAPNASPFSEGWYSLNDIYHEHRNFYLASCINEGCVADSTVCVAEQLEQHTWAYNGKNYHLSGKSQHTYIHECSICKDTKEVLLPCGGNGNGNCPVQIQTVGTQKQ